MQYVNINNIRQAITAFDDARQGLRKFAFVPGPQAPPPQAGGPPPGMDPNMPPPPPGGDPNMPPPPPGGDPNAMPPGGDPNAMPPPGDPNAMPPGGDPNAMPPGGDPNAMPPGGAPPEGGGMDPNTENALATLADGMQNVADTVENQQSQMDQLRKEQLNIQQRLDEKEQEDKLRESAPFEGSTRTQKDVSLADVAGYH